MTIPGSPAVRRRRLAAELRALRERTGKSGDSVAAALHWSPSKISRYELARTGLKIAEVEKLLNYYDVGSPRREQLLELAKDAARKGWWEAYADGLSEDYQQFIGLEHEARSIAIWHVEVVTGLLQTKAYARHIISSYGQVEPIAPRMIDRLVTVRMHRQEVLERDPPVQLSVVFDESVLRRRVGTNEVMYEQLQRLLRESERPNVTLRIFPLDQQHTIYGESFVIFGFGSDSSGTVLQDVVTSELLRNLYAVETERETHLHRIAYRHLFETALDPQASRELIASIAESAWSRRS
jgi:transcriptional regulator with XRE-family HTH domain